MKKIAAVLFAFYIFTRAFAVSAEIGFVLGTTHDDLPEYVLQSMSTEQRKEYCIELGFRLMNCENPYTPESICRADSSYVSNCICRPEYNLECKETDGLRGIGEKCDGKYAKCCKLTCPNSYATLINCQNQGLEEVHSERDYNECGEICYLCKDKCPQGTPEDQCPSGQSCIPFPGISSHLGRRCCQCGCPQGQKECMGFCIGQDECCPGCKDDEKCSGGICVAK